jgi:predicted nucleotidyltransferase
MEALNRLIQKAENDQDVLAVMVFGSYARNETKSTSDIDVCIVLQPRQFNNLFLSNKKWSIWG